MIDHDVVGYRELEERYCPTLQRNVAFAVMRCGNTELYSTCLELNDCKNDPVNKINKLAE